MNETALVLAYLKAVSEQLDKVIALLEQQNLMLAHTVNINNFTQGAQAGQVIAGTDGKQEQKGES